MRVISAEGLIGFKLQALVNDPSRGRDLDDIRALLRAQRGRLNMTEVQEYFALFDRRRCLMNCLPRLPSSGAEEAGQPLVGGDVLDVEWAGRGDLSDWVELMEVVEALCPVWPERERVEGGVYRL